MWYWYQSSHLTHKKAKKAYFSKCPTTPDWPLRTFGIKQLAQTIYACVEVCVCMWWWTTGAPSRYPNLLLPGRSTLMTSVGVKVAISSTSSLWDKNSSGRLSSDMEDSCSEWVGKETWPDDDRHSLYLPSSTILASPTPSWLHQLQHIGTCGIHTHLLSVHIWTYTYAHTHTSLV